MKVLKSGIRFLDPSLMSVLLLVLVLLKDQVHGAFTQNIESSIGRQFLSTTASTPFQRRREQSASASIFSQDTLRAPGALSLSSNAKSISGSSCRRSSSALCSTANNNAPGPKQYNHVLAILTMPYTSMDRIANEAVLYAALQHTSKLSIVLKCEGGKAPSLASLRRYVGEVYSQLWDFAMATEDAVHFNNVVVYPQSFPNAAAESWIYILPDLDAICSHDSICGWVSEEATGRGTQFQFLEGNGVGGLDTHVNAVNSDRTSRGLPPVHALHVSHWPIGASSGLLMQEKVVFVDDDIPITESSIAQNYGAEFEDNDDGNYDECTMLGGATIPANCLFNNVAVGGTFDGLHYGHRKLLSLAVSSVYPVTGKLTVGVTVDEMLQSKQFAEYIPPIEERMEGVREFLHRLAPGMKNRINIEPISDAFGPPGMPGKGKDYDALILSHETLETGVKLNKHRKENLGYDSLTLLCTRRTEAYGMSSTTLRRLRSMTKVDSRV